MGTPVVGDTSMHVRDLRYFTTGDRPVVHVINEKGTYTSHMNKPPLVLPCVGGAWADSRSVTAPAAPALPIVPAAMSVHAEVAAVAPAALMESAPAEAKAAAYTDVAAFVELFATAFPPK